MVKSGEIEAIKVGRKLMVPQKTVSEILGESGVPGDRRARILGLGLHAEADALVLDVGLHELFDSSEKVLDGEDVKIGFGDESQISLGIHEMEKALASFLDGLGGLSDIFEVFLA